MLLKNAFIIITTFNKPGPIKVYVPLLYYFQTTLYKVRQFIKLNTMYIIKNTM